MGWTVRVAACGLLSTAAACDSKGGRSDYSNAVDSGAVAPAARLDTSMTRNSPDSTTGGPDRTGRRGVAGDTLSTRGRPAGTGVRPQDTTSKRP
jgi:hypothetical protein